MLLIDLFCGAGGAAKGYHDAGFDEIIGVDINPQPRYPYEFIQGDVFEVWDTLPHDRVFMYHASPICKRFSTATNTSKTKENHINQIPDIRRMFINYKKPYVIENVPGAPLINPLVLCGSMFGLRVIRHRLFECDPVLWFTPSQCNHDGGCSPISGKDENGKRILSSFATGKKYISVVGHSFKASDGAIAMDIDWMTRDELAQAIPPAYTKYIGTQILSLVGESGE